MPSSEPSAVSAPPSPLAARGYIVAAAALWSTGGAAVKLASELEATQIAGGRALVSALVLFALIPGARGRWSPRVLGAGLFYAATNILFVYANTRTTAGATIFLQNIAPVWVLVLSPFLLGERPTRLEALSVPLSLLGSSLFFAGDLDGGRLEGNLSALSASVTYALLIISYRQLSGPEGLTATVAGSVLVVLVTAPWALQGPAPTLTGVGVILYLGALQQGLAALLFIRGIRGVSALEGALLVLVEPLLSPVFAFVLIGERMARWAVGGAMLILLGAGLRMGASLRSPRAPEP